MAKPYDAIKEYKQQVKRIQNFWKRAENRGYVFNKKGVITNPSKINKSSVERLKKFTANELYKRSKYQLPDTDIYIKGTEGRKYERAKAAKKGWEIRKDYHRKRKQDMGVDMLPNEADEVLSNLGEEIAKFAHENLDLKFLNEITEEANDMTGTLRLGYNAWFNTKMQSNGKTVSMLIRMGLARHGLKGFVKLINENANEIRALLNAIYDSKQQTGTSAEQHIAGLATILNGGTLSREQGEDIEDLQYQFWTEGLTDWE